MGLFDFIFGKKQNQSTAPRKPNALESLSRTSYNRKWKQIIENQITIQVAAGKKLDYRLTSEHYVARQIENMLKGYAVGSNPSSIRTAGRAYGDDERAAFNGLTDLFEGTSEYDDYVKTSKIGLVHIIVQKEANRDFRYGSNLLSYLTGFSKDDEGYYTSLMLDLMDGYETKKHLYVLMQTYIQLPADNFDNLKDEILNRIYKNSTPKEVGAAILNDPDVVRSYMDLRHDQFAQSGLSQKVDPQWTSITETWFKTIEEPVGHLTLLAYELFYNYNKSDGDKVMLKKLTEKSSIGYDTLHTFLKLFISQKQTGNLISGTWIHKLVKGYFVNEPIDPQSYALIKQAMSVCDTISRAKKLNDFLYSKSDALYNIHSAELHQLLHSGELHDLAIARLYGGNKNATTYVNNIITLVNQIMPAVMLKEGKNAYTVRIGGEEISIGTKELFKINDALSRQGVPYQLVDLSFVSADKGVNVKQRSTLILNEDQFDTVQEFIDTSQYSKNNLDNNKAIRFVETVGEAEPLINVVSKLKKAQSSSVASNRFIHDIKWKDVKLDVVDQFSNPRLWYGVMHHIVSAPNTVRPSETWKKKMLSIKDEMAPEDYTIGIIRLVQHMEDNDIWFTKDNLKALRGMIWASSIMDEDLAFVQMESICQRCFERVPGVGPQSISGGNCCVTALVDMESPKAYSSLVRLQSEAKYDRLKNLIRDELRRFEQKFKSSVATLKEAAQDDFGFVDGAARMKVEDYEVRWELKNYKTKSRWFDQDGNKLSKTPSIKDYTITQTMAAKTKTINQGVETFYNRMLGYRFSDISWTAEDWKRNYLNHAFVGLVMDRLLWVVDHVDGRQESYIVREGKMIDVFHAAITLGEDDTIRLYHKTLVLEEINEAWKSFFVKHKIESIYDYFYGQDYDGATQDDILDFLNDYDISNGVHGWFSLGKPRAEFLVLPYVHKIAVLKNIDQESNANNKKLKIVFFELPEDQPRYNYHWDNLTTEVSTSDISKTVLYEVKNDIIAGLTRSMLQRKKFGDWSVEDLLKIPFFRQLDTFFTKLTEQNLILGLQYDNLVLNFSGLKNDYEYDLRQFRLSVPSRPKETRYFDRSIHGKPRTNYAMKVGMPIDLHPSIQALLGFMPIMISGKGEDFYWIKDWINN